MSRNLQKCSRKKEMGRNLSFPQMLSVFTTMLLALVLISSCDSPLSPNQHRTQSSGTPLPTIASRSPGNEPSFCTGAADQTAWFGPENVRQVDSAVPPPVPSGFVAGYSVGDFNAPCIMPKVGVVRIEVFIQTKLVFKYFYGNNRNFNPEFDPGDTKASIILDFTKGAAQVIISPTCHAKVNAVTNPDCAHAYPLNGKNGLLVNWFRWKVDPALPGFLPGTEFLTIQYAFKIAALRKEWKTFAQHGIPPINGLIHFAFEPDTGNVCLKGTIDDFPATAVHQVHYDASAKATAITLARHQEARLLGPVGLTDPYHRTEAHIGNQCGQSLTGSSPTNPLGKVDWTKMPPNIDKVDSCILPRIPGGNASQGLALAQVKFADVTGDGFPEAFVVLACVGSTMFSPQRLDVYNGASDPNNPQRIATLLGYNDTYYEPDTGPITIRSITFTSETVIATFDGNWAYDENKNMWYPASHVIFSFTWNGHGFTRNSRSVVQVT